MMTGRFHWLAALLMIVLALPLAAQETDDANGDEAASEDAGEDAKKKPTIYKELPPPFVTHVGKPSQSLSYVKAEVTLRLDSKKAGAAVEQHAPRLRHEMVMMLTNASLDAVSDAPGQETLRNDVLTRFNEVLEEEKTGAAIKDLLFTTFVIQR
ncbi:flagellar FliL protein [Tamilnaduibacter salinus]|uniref:Flagellar protein FliL n=1 Tax=Tamilnaduibacter salinus TaxID=1484056 RepID=A0A2U1CXB9_9GAMM|nr:flagellar basal body-associated FliL family protein [Tamilnaduibacter salinus]PVY76904.1 flagellar FliL protein [Tamilnaduibacter salinus]